MSDIERFLIFAAVGASGVVVDLGVFWTLLKTLGKAKFWDNSKLRSATVFHTMSFLVANISNFILNKAFTFSDSKKDDPSWLTYFLVSLLSLGISSIFIQYFAKDCYHEWFKKVYSQATKKISLLKKLKPDKNKWYLVLKIIAILIAMVINYNGYRVFVF